MPKQTGISKHEMLKMAARGVPAYGHPHYNKIIVNFPVPEQACFSSDDMFCCPAITPSRKKTRPALLCPLHNRA